MRWFLSPALILALALGGCARLPALDSRVASTAFTDTASTPLGRAVAPLVAAHPGQSGVYGLLDARNAFTARAVLADAATRSLDVQYYIWRNDISGALLFDALRAAAQRGVRVRLLLDDFGTSGIDATLALLDAHPNIEVRLFNPFALRRLRLLGYLTEFGRLNRRMHNKSFTADGMVTIIGGRNIGDKYFDAAGDTLFADLDVLAIGAVVQPVSDDFDRYWNSASAYPLHLIVEPQPDAAAVRREAPDVDAGPPAQAYQVALRASPLLPGLAGQTLPLEWAPTRLVSDDPAKALEREPPDSGVETQLRQLIGTPAREFDLVAPYFVPGPAITAELVALARSGVAVRVLTNALEATDVGAVHAGYGKWRAPLLQAGVRLYEMRRSWPLEDRSRRPGPLISSGSSLHAKTFAVDGARMFIGSLNFDPRSINLNTEMGFLIDSPAMALQLKATLDGGLAQRAYEVKLAPDGSIYWIEDQQGVAIRHDTEPGTSFWRRLGVRVMSWMPIDWLL
ncbi:MAG: phospholipase D family protein [Pseudomonadota bacterium]